MYLFNSRDVDFKSPFGAVECHTNVHFTFPISDKVWVKEVVLVLRKGDVCTRHHLVYQKNANFHSYFSLNLRLDDVGIFFYHFEVDFDNGNIVHVGRQLDGSSQQGEWVKEWQQTVYSEDFVSPSWSQNAVIYHIFVDRFSRISNNRTPDTGYLVSWDTDINVIDPDGIYRANDFYGGNLQGIISKLDYLYGLGVNIIYLSPIFKASSNHRYDTSDYLQIDTLLGTQTDFVELLEKANLLGISIMLDGVFNHTGADSIYFDKFDKHHGTGAFNNRNSQYYNWYTFFDDYTYDCWWGCTNVPNIKKDCQEFQKFITDQVLTKWNNLGVKAWRLDVVDELSNSFIQTIRQTLKEKSSDILLIGEVWEDASTKVAYGENKEYFDGKKLDGVMNYVFKDAIIDYIKTEDAVKFKNTVTDIQENYPQFVLSNSMTLLGTHDTIRIINSLADIPEMLSKDERKNFRLSYSQYYKAKHRLMVASAIQFFLDGCPTIFYGDEIGLEGLDDPINRRPYPSIVDKDLEEHYRKLGNLRRQYPNDFAKMSKITIELNDLTISKGNVKLNIKIKDLLFKIERGV